MSFADDEVCGGSIVSVAGVLIQRRWQRGEREGRGKKVGGGGDEPGRECVQVELVEC